MTCQRSAIYNDNAQLYAPIFPFDSILLYYSSIHHGIELHYNNMCFVPVKYYYNTSLDFYLDIFML